MIQSVFMRPFWNNTCSGHTTRLCAIVNCSLLMVHQNVHQHVHQNVHQGVLCAAGALGRLASEDQWPVGDSWRDVNCWDVNWARRNFKVRVDQGATVQCRIVDGLAAGVSPGQSASQIFTRGQSASQMAPEHTRVQLYWGFTSWWQPGQTEALTGGLDWSCAIELSTE